MRHWLTIILVIGALLCAVALAPALQQDAGYVLIELGQWTIESNVLVLGGMLLLLMIALKLLFWFLSLPRRAAVNLARRRLENGLLALAEGNWEQAEKALSKAADSSAAPVAAYLAAARAADGHDGDAQAITRRQQSYLQAADDGHARTRFLIHLSKARLLINKGRYEQAIPLLQHCLKQRRRHRQALRMLAQCHRELGQWSALRDLLPAMRKAGLLDRNSSADLERLSINNELAAATDAEQLQKTWDSLLRAQRQQTDHIARYAEQALQFDFPRLAEAVLIQALDRASGPVLADPVLTDLYARAHLEPTEQALQRAQQWQRKHPDDAGIQRLLGQLYVQAEQWGKARDHLQESLRLKADATSYTMLGELLHEQGDSDAAANCFFNALQLGGPAAASAPAATRQLTPAPLRPLYPERAISAPRPANNADNEHAQALETASEAELAPGETSSNATLASRAETISEERTQPTAQHHPRQQATATRAEADVDDAVGDVAAVPTDFQPGVRGAKSKES